MPIPVCHRQARYTGVSVQPADAGFGRLCLPVNVGDIGVRIKRPNPTHCAGGIECGNCDDAGIAKTVKQEYAISVCHLCILLRPVPSSGRVRRESPCHWMVAQGGGLGCPMVPQSNHNVVMLQCGMPVLGYARWSKKNGGGEAPVPVVKLLRVHGWMVRCLECCVAN
jgi:hypothetical protein